MQVRSEQFKELSLQALASKQVQSSLSRVSEGFDMARRRAVTELTPEVWEEYREQGRRIKEHTIANLDYYLELLTDRVQQNGGPSTLPAILKRRPILCWRWRAAEE